MELMLTVDQIGQVSVQCDGSSSHTFPINSLLPNEKNPAAPPQPLEDPLRFGATVYAALFPVGSSTALKLGKETERVLIIATDNALDAIPWEYALDEEGFLATRLNFVRGLKKPQPVRNPTNPLHVVAVCSNPIDENLPPLNIEPEWQRLKDIFGMLNTGAQLERVRPATAARMGLHLANAEVNVVHFTGHGTVINGEAGLCFEDESGRVRVIRAREFNDEIKGKAFLAVLSACISATPGLTEFSNLAHLLVERGLPYALGMRFSVAEADALCFTRHLYEGLAAGIPLEHAVTRARRELAYNNPRAWAVGVPVLYTSLNTPAAGFQHQPGASVIKEHCPPLELNALPPFQGVFQGRVADQIQLGKWLAGDVRPRYITLLGVGGQGKTALARQVAERFAWAWPGGAYALSLEILPSHDDFLIQLSNLLGLPLPTPPEPQAVERQILARLNARRTLLIFDNCETLIQAVEANYPDSIRLAAILKDSFSASTGLLFTSRRAFGWGQLEVILELFGLTEHNGARLFLDAASQRANQITAAQAEALSTRLAGHPLSLRLLGLAFADLALEYSEFAREMDDQLAKAEDKYKDLDHRQRTLFANIDTSTAYLSQELISTLADLRLFQAPFLPEIAAKILDPDHEESLIPDRLQALWKRGLLIRLVEPYSESNLLYTLIPPIRLYTRQALPHTTPDSILADRFGETYSSLISAVYSVINQGGPLLPLARLCEADFDQVLGILKGKDLAQTAQMWGILVFRLGNPVKGRRVLEMGLTVIQGSNTELESDILDNIGVIFSSTGSNASALNFYNLALPIRTEVGDHSGEATTLNNIGGVYRSIGQPQEALRHFNLALPIHREVGNRGGEATTLNNIGTVYQAIGQPQEALRHFNLALPIHREVGNRSGEATTLTNIGMVHRTIGQPQEALRHFNLALPIRREIGDRSGEADTLNNIGSVYQAIGQPQEALRHFNLALPIRREVGNRRGEATTLNNIGVVYRAIGQPQEALRYFNLSLPISREVGDRRGEASNLNNIATIYLDEDQTDQAIPLFEQVIVIDRLTGAVHIEADDLFFLANILSSRLHRSQDAIPLLEQSIRLFHLHHLEHDDAGRSLAQHQHFLTQLQSGANQNDPYPPNPMPAIQSFVAADTLEKIRQALDSNPLLLTDSRIETIFEENIKRIEEQQPQFAQKLAFYLSLLRDAKANGVPAALARLKTAL